MVKHCLSHHPETQRWGGGGGVLMKKGETPPQSPPRNPWVGGTVEYYSRTGPAPPTPPPSNFFNKRLTPAAITLPLV